MSARDLRQGFLDERSHGEPILLVEHADQPARPGSGEPGQGVAVGPGPANSLISARGKGVVLNEPSVIAVRVGQPSNDPEVVAAVGSRARQMLGRAPGALNVVRPLREGVVANFTLTQAMLKHFIREVHEMRAVRRCASSPARSRRASWMNLAASATEGPKTCARSRLTCDDPGRVTLR